MSLVTIEVRRNYENAKLRALLTTALSDYLFHGGLFSSKDVPSVHINIIERAKNAEL